MRIGIIGATGIVGNKLLNIFYDHGYCSKKYTSFKLAASDNSAGSNVHIKEFTYELIKVSEDFFDSLDVVFFCADNETSIKWVPIAQLKGAFVIDNSSAFRMYENVPLVIPEINGHLIESSNGVIANPNCCTALLCMILYPLLSLSEIVSVDVSTYQAVSGAGNAGIAELTSQMKSFVHCKEIIPRTFPSQICANCFSHNTKIDSDTGYNDEELKIASETPKILNRPNIDVSATCVRIPVFTSHSESVKIVFATKVNESDIRKVLENFNGVTVMDDRENNKFPEPLIASNNTNVFVGRIRKRLNDETGKVYNMFICGDQLLKGASYNAFQIFKEFEKLYLLHSSKFNVNTEENLMCVQI